MRRDQVHLLVACATLAHAQLPTGSPERLKIKEAIHALLQQEPHAIVPADMPPDMVHKTLGTE
jgi:hypothetical protein